jgi:hypothetical protein
MATVPRPRNFRDLIASYIQSGSGRVHMAMKITPSLRRFRDYMAVGRRAFLVEDIEDGALPLYDKDPIVPAYVVGEGGDSVLSQTYGERIICPMFEIAALTDTPASEIRERRYDFVKRSLELAVSAIKEKEDARVFNTINSLATDPDNPHDDIGVAAPMTADVISDAVSIIEEHGLRAARIFMSGRDYADIRKNDHSVLDQTSLGSMWRTGYVGKIYGAQVIRSRVIAPGTIYITGEREYFGRMPVRQELTAINADKPWERRVGFSLWEQLGVLTYNFLASQRILIDRPAIAA